MIAFAALVSSLVLSLHFHPGETLHRHTTIIDRTNWILPKARLEAFRRGGAVITEDVRTTIDSRETVAGIAAGMVHLSGLTVVSSYDVPRQRKIDSREIVDSRLTARNHAPGLENQLEVAEAATADLPAGAVKLGSGWRTRELVTTSLGSGTLTIVHTVARVENSRVEIEIAGRGVITGKEYNLPKLLPGSIEIHGTAWYDPQAGLFTHEKYAIHNTLVKPAGPERIGFDEFETVDIVTVQEG